MWSTALLAAACAGEPGTTVVTPAADVDALAVGGHRLYWLQADGQSDAIWTSADSGEQARGLGAAASTQLPVDGGLVYWTTPTLVRMPLDGSAAPQPSQLAPPLPFVVDGGELFWVDGGQIFRRSIDGAGGPPALVVDAGIGIDALAVDGARVYFADQRAQLRVVDRQGGAASVLATLDVSGVELTAGAGFVFVRTRHTACDDSGNDCVWRVPESGGPPALVVTSGTFLAWLLVGDTLYFSDGDISKEGVTSIRRMPAGGGPVTTLCTLSRQVLALASDGRRLWFGATVHYSHTNDPEQQSYPWVADAGGSGRIAWLPL